MCGIFGVSKKTTHDFIKKFEKFHFNRGPDDFNFFLDNHVTLLHNRLSILDISNGKQPMQYKDYIIVYNGEIFNSPYLRKNLETNGYIFETKNSDTEVLLKLYDFKKEEMLQDLNGMFAFVIYDKKKKLFFGAVDQFSIKPLYYTILNGDFYFSSEIKALLNVEGISHEICKKNINYYFSLQYSPCEFTMYEKIKKVKNKEFFTYDLNSKIFSTKKYHRKKISYQFNNYFDVINCGKNNIQQSVKNWMLSDVDIACSLSGGLDSSLIASIYSANSSKKINTISIGFHDIDKEYDESVYAEKVADFIGSNHTSIKVSSSELSDDLELIIDNLSEPYAGSLASWFVYKNLNKQKVIFTGTGADELFGNYGKWKDFQMSERFISNFIKSLSLQDKEHFKSYYGFLYKKIFYEDELISIFNNSTENDIISLINNLKLSNYDNSKKIIQEIDMKLQLPWEFLYITDRLSMINSVEARTPFLDNLMVDYTESIDSKYYGGFFNSKRIIKDIAKNLIPDEIISRKKKGFVLPKNSWLKGKYYKQLQKYISKDYIKKQGIFNYNGLEILNNKFQLLNNENITEKVWTFFIFQFWYEKKYSTFKF
jgi:asparagine synthase (glutamine-hydrolysing)